VIKETTAIKETAMIKEMTAVWLRTRLVWPTRPKRRGVGAVGVATVVNLSRKMGSQRLEEIETHDIIVLIEEWILDCIK
jgi:hypothetical protein